MKVQDVIFCGKAINDETGVSATNIFPALNPEYIPGLFTFSIVITILGIDTNTEHRIALRFASPTNDDVVNIETVMPIIESSDTNLPNEYKGVNLAMDWNNVNFHQSGLYSLEVFVDGNMLEEKHIYVKGKNE